VTAPFTLEELLEALHVAPQIKLEEFRSSEEWARILGVSRARTRALIGEGLRQGRVEHRNVYRTWQGGYSLCH